MRKDTIQSRKQLGFNMQNGVKANYGTMGVNAQVKRGDCSGQNNRETQTDSIAPWAQKGWKAAGSVTTSRVTHASPGGLYARH